MDGDVQQQYLTAEQAYGDGDFTHAAEIANSLLKQLDGSDGTDAEQEARLAWRAFVALLLGHIHFHGLHQPDQALSHYQLVLESEPPDTLRELAEQGVERSRSEIETRALNTTPDRRPEADVEIHTPPSRGFAPEPSINLPEPKDIDTSAEGSLIRDPFLSAVPPRSGNDAYRSASAAPWLGEGVTLAPYEVEADQQTNQHQEPDRTGASSKATATDSQPLPLEEATNESTAPVEQVSSSPELGTNRPLETENAELIHQETAAIGTATTLIHEDEPSEDHPMDPPPHQAGDSKAPVDLTPWLLRRTLSFNKP